LNFAVFQDDWRAVLDGCQRENVWVTLVGSQLETSRRAVQLAAAYPTGVYAAVGLHPVHVSDQPQPFHAEDYAALIESSPKVVAVGESGVDYYRLPAGRELIELERQREIFLAHLSLARRYNRALIMHTRERPAGPRGAYADLLRLLESERRVGLPRGVIHCFLGTLQEAEAFTALGFYVGITGILTFKKKGEALQSVVAGLPLERIVVETDSPYLTPEPHRGQRNQPPYVALVAQCIATIKGIDFAIVAQQTSRNALELFRLSA